MSANESDASLVNSVRNRIRLTALDLEDVQVSFSTTLYDVSMEHHWNVN